MPIYEYVCQDCGEEFEKKVSFDSKEKIICPACQSGRVQKLLSAPGIIFKGSGFHKTDYRKKEPPCRKCPKREVCEQKKKN